MIKRAKDHEQQIILGVTAQADTREESDPAVHAIRGGEGRDLGNLAAWLILIEAMDEEASG
jgi:hypothetical protein